MSISFISIDIARYFEAFDTIFSAQIQLFVSPFIKSQFGIFKPIPSYQIFSVHLKYFPTPTKWMTNIVARVSEYFKNNKTKDILARSIVLYLIQFHGDIPWMVKAHTSMYTYTRRWRPLCRERSNTKKAGSRVGALFHGRAKIFIVWKWALVERLVRVYIRRRVSTLFLECPGTHGPETRVKALHYIAGRGFRSRREEVGSRNRAGNSISCYLNGVMGRDPPPSSIRAVRAAKSITMIIRRDSSRISSDSPPHPWTFLIIKSSGKSLILGRLDGVW